VGVGAPASTNLFRRRDAEARGLDKDTVAGACGLAAVTILGFQMGDVPAPGVISVVTRGPRDDVRNLDGLPAGCEYWLRVPNLDIVPGLDDPGEPAVSPFQVRKER